MTIENTTEERRVRMGSLVQNGVTHYYREEYDVEVNNTQNTVTETFAYAPEVFWGLTKEQVRTLLAERASRTDEQEKAWELVTQLDEE